MVPPDRGEPTFYVGSSSDIALIGRFVSDPARKRTDGENLDRIDVEKLALHPEFQSPLNPKSRLVVPASVFCILYCLALPALMSYARPFMETKVGPVNVAFLFALSQFFIAWIVATVYVRAANIFDSVEKPNPWIV